MTSLSRPNAVAVMSLLQTALREMIAAVPSMDVTTVARRKWEHTLENVDEILDELRCACGQPIAGLHDAQFVCQRCLDKWTTCGACGNDLLVAEAVTPADADGLFHALCIGGER